MLKRAIRDREVWPYYLAGGAGICLAVTGFGYYVYDVLNGAQWGAMAPSGIALAGVVLYRVARRAALDRK